MEIEKLKDMLRNAAGGPVGIQMCQEAADALEQLQAENDRLQAELEKEEAARKKQADILYELRGQRYEQTTAIDQLRAENDRLKEEVQQMRWIPVEEKLPEKENAQVFMTDGESCFISSRNNMMCFLGCEGFFIPGKAANITHWMPPPDPPARRPSPAGWRKGENF